MGAFENELARVERLFTSAGVAPQVVDRRLLTRLGEVEARLAAGEKLPTTDELASLAEALGLDATTLAIRLEQAARTVLP